MANPFDVQPRRWTNLTVLSDDVDFAYCYVFYHQDDGSVSLALGDRWNWDVSDPLSIGYPSLGGNPTWFVIDPTMVGPILAELEKRAIENDDFVSASRIFDARKAFKV